MGGDVRRAAGTRAVLNLLPLPWRLFGDGAGRAADLAAFDAGTSYMVVAFARQDAVFRRGALFLTRYPADVVWYFAPARLALQPFPSRPPSTSAPSLPPRSRT